MIKAEMKLKWTCLRSVPRPMKTGFVALVLKSCHPVTTTVTWVRTTRCSRSRVRQCEPSPRLGCSHGHKLPPGDSPALGYSLQLGQSSFKNNDLLHEHLLRGAGAGHFTVVWCPSTTYGERSATLTFQRSEAASVLCSAQLVVWYGVQRCGHDVCESRSVKI